MVNEAGLNPLSGANQWFQVEPIYTSCAQPL